MSESDSFIDEVAEEVRRDRLFALMRKYGWIAILGVVLIVGGAAYNEWRKAHAEASAQAFGDAVIAAMASDQADARVAALSGVPADGTSGHAAILGLLTAAEAVAAKDTASAVAALRDVAANADIPDSYRQLAQLKMVSLAGTAMDAAERDSILAALAAPGAPYRALAIEQQALALLADGQTDAAATLLQDISQDADVTPGLQGRVQQLLVALGKSAPGE